MSGIAGIYCFDGRPVQPEKITAMAEAIKHRGPDRQGIWCNGSIGLANLLLQTTPESLHETLPYYDTEAQVAITADARIDNREELFAHFSFQPVIQPTISDSRLILEAYKKWGMDCPKYLLGDFAVVIWDKKERRFFAFRDHFGVRPLYYSLSKAFLFFGSELKALFALGEISYEINPTHLADFMSLQHDGSSTFYKEIKILPPGHWLKIDHLHKSKTNRYWQLEPGPILKLKNQNEYTEAFDEVFQESVRCRLRRIGPIGSHLSGGLDSTSVSCTARDIILEKNDEPLHTFSCVFDSLPQCNEAEYINQVLARGGIIPHVIKADNYPSKEIYDELLDTFEEPCSAFNFWPIWQVYKTCRSAGINVLLSGWDGDTTVSHGTGRLIELARTWKWFTLIREGETYASHFNIPPGKVTYYYLKKFSKLTPFFNTLAYIKHKVISPKSSQKPKGDIADKFFLNKNFYCHKEFESRYQSLNVKIDEQKINEQNKQIRKLNSPAMVNTLQQLDKCTAHFSIEYRYPFWDKRLIGFCNSLPAEQKLDQGYNRVIMRRAMQKKMPAAVCWRGGKADLAPFSNAFVMNIIENYDVIKSSRISQLGKYINENIVSQFFLNANKTINSSNAISFWRMLALMLWMKRSEECQVSLALGENNQKEVTK